MKRREQVGEADVPASKGTRSEADGATESVEDPRPTSAVDSDPSGAGCPHPPQESEHWIRGGLIAQGRARMRRMRLESEYLPGIEAPPFTPEQLEELPTEQLKRMLPGMSRDDVVNGLLGETRDSVGARPQLSEELMRSPKKREWLRNFLSALTEAIESLPPDERPDAYRSLAAQCSIDRETGVESGQAAEQIPPADRPTDTRG